MADATEEWDSSPHLSGLAWADGSLWVVWDLLCGVVERGPRVTAGCSKESIRYHEIWDSGCVRMVSVQKRRLGAHAGDPQPPDRCFSDYRASWLRPWSWSTVEWELSGSHTQLHTSRLCASEKLLMKTCFFNLQNGDSNTNPKCLICISKIPKYPTAEYIFASPWQTHLTTKPYLTWHGACWGLSLSHLLSIYCILLIDTNVSD